VARIWLSIPVEQARGRGEGLLAGNHIAAVNNALRLSRGCGGEQLGSVRDGYV
jgi:hypothetical protein